VATEVENEKIVFNQIYKVLLAWWMVFCAFTKVAKKQNGGLLPNNITHNWLIFQLLPLVVVDGNHHFLAFMNSYLVGVPLQMLLDLLDTTRPAAVLGSAFGHNNFSTSLIKLRLLANNTWVLLQIQVPEFVDLSSVQ
jgi:hypothetical protein